MEARCPRNPEAAPSPEGFRRRRRRLSRKGTKPREGSFIYSTEIPWSCPSTRGQGQRLPPTASLLTAGQPYPTLILPWPLVLILVYFLYFMMLYILQALLSLERLPLPGLAHSSRANGSCGNTLSTRKPTSPGPMPPPPSLLALKLRANIPPALHHPGPDMGQPYSPGHHDCSN